MQAYVEPYYSGKKVAFLKPCQKKLQRMKPQQEVNSNVVIQ